MLDLGASDGALVARDIQKNARVRIGPLKARDETARTGRALEVIFSGGMVSEKCGHDQQSCK